MKHRSIALQLGINNSQKNGLELGGEGEIRIQRMRREFCLLLARSFCCALSTGSRYMHLVTSALSVLTGVFALNALVV